MLRPSLIVRFRSLATMQRPQQWALAILLCLALCAGRVHAQVDLGQVTGTVHDASGATVPGAEVSIVNSATSLTRNARTNQQGIYSMPSLQSGGYVVTVTAPGFSAATVPVVVRGGETSSQDVSLGVANQVTRVDVQAGYMDQERESHEVGLNIDSQELTQLPNNGGNPLNIALLAAGSESASDASEPTSSGQYFGVTSNQLNLGGGMDSQTDYLQDGVENVTLFTQSANMLPSVDAIQQMNIIVNGADARYARPSAVNIITKGGSNVFHGSAYDFLQNDLLNAQDYNLAGATQVKTPVRYNQFGGTFGGPILRNRLFFFGSYSGLRLQDTYYATTRIPTEAERTGDYSADTVALYDPLTYGTAGTNTSFLTETGKNAIPANRISPFAKTLLTYLPHSNIPLNTALNINYQIPLKDTVSSDEYLGRVDWTLSPKDQIYVAGGYSKSPKTTPSIAPTLFGGYNNISAVNGFVTETHIISSNLANTFHVGYNRSVLLQTVLGVGARPYYQEFGLQNLSPAPSQWAPPYVVTTSYFAVAANDTTAATTGLGNRYAPQGGTQNRFQYADQVNYQVGRHTLSMGAEFIRTQLDANWVIQNNGYYSFNSNMTARYVAKTKKANGDGFADVLLGYPSTVGGATGVSIGAFREWQVNGYVQDDWKVLPQLSLNFGIRYDFDNPPNDKNGKSSIYDLPSNKIVAGTWMTNYRDVSPRLGFAYNPEKNTTIRGGYGIYFASSPYNFLQFLLAHPPNFITQSLSFTQAKPVAVTSVFSANPSATGITPQTLGLKMPDVNVEQYNLVVEHVFRTRYSLMVGYVGEAGRHESVRLNANQPNSKASAASTTFDVRPYTYAGDVYGQYNVGSSNSNALQAKFEGQVARGTHVIASYTWSKSMNISDGDRNVIDNYYHPEYYYSLAAWDRTHHLNVATILQLPFGHGQRWGNGAPRLIDLVAGGWQFTPFYRFGTGLPVSVTATNTADTSSIGSFMAQKICDPNKGFTRSKSEWFNTNCFVQPGNAVYGIGGRNSVREPNLNQLDLGLSKTFHLFEGNDLQLRIESFNALNHPQFSLPGSTAVSSASLGAINGTAKPMRVAQIGARYTF